MGAPSLSSLKGFSPPGGQVGSWGLFIPSVDGRRCFQGRFEISGAFPAKEECPGFGVSGSECAFPGELGFVSPTRRDEGSRCRFLSVLSPRDLSARAWVIIVIPPRRVL